MPRWLGGLLLLLIFIAWIQPDPVGAGASAGNAVDSMIVFIRSVGNRVTLTEGTATRSSTGSGGGSVTAPSGGIGTGDGTLAAGDGAAVALLDDLGAAAALLGGLGAVAAVLVVRARRTGARPRGRYAAVALGVLVASGFPAVAEAAEPAPQPLRAAVPMALHIPAIGVDTSLVKLGLNADSTMEVPGTARLAGWYRFAPTPGERGPAVITAHVDWRHERGVFHDLAKLRPGDELTVKRVDGTAATFRVERVARYPKSAFPTGQVFGEVARPELRLITCGGELDRLTHNYRDNVVVFASMVGTA